jgi:large subunit ribosomal protein L22
MKRRMESKLQLKRLRVAPRKVRLIADLIRGMELEQAKVVLKNTVKRSSEPISKMIDSAIANAKHNFNIEGDLYIKEIKVDEGIKMKRWMPWARGIARPIIKKTSHVTMIVGDKQNREAKGKKQDIQVVRQETVVKDVKKKKEEKKTEIKPKQESGIKKMFRRKSF